MAAWRMDGEGMEKEWRRCGEGIRRAEVEAGKPVEKLPDQTR